MTRSQYKQASDDNDGNHSSVTLSDNDNRMLKGIDMSKFKQIKSQMVLCKLCG